jgi:hypothetical protein
MSFIQIISTENLIEVETSESDYHAEIQNNLPHKKRFRKRESAPAPLRSIHPKCYKCKQCGEQFNSQSAVTVIIIIFLIIIMSNKYVHLFNQTLIAGT